MTKNQYPPHIIAGVAAGIVGLLVFLIIHHITILPIWFIFPIGAIIAAAGGAAVGWAFDTMRAQLPAHPMLAALLLSGLLTLTQLPGLLIGQANGPAFDLAASEFIPAMRGELIRRFTFDLIFMAAAVGAAIGWLLTKDKPAAFAMATAAVVFAVGPGHNIPFFVGFEFSLLKNMIWLMTGIILSSALTLGGVVWWLER